MFLKKGSIFFNLFKLLGHSNFLSASGKRHQRWIKHPESWQHPHKVRLGCLGRNTNMGKRGHISHWPCSSHLPGTETTYENNTRGGNLHLATVLMDELALTYSVYGLAPWKGSGCSFLCTLAPKDVDYNFYCVSMTNGTEKLDWGLQPASGQDCLSCAQESKA